MAMRYRWYRVGVPDSSAKLSRYIDASVPEESKGVGFYSIVGGLGREQLRFWWKSPVVITRIDDEGAVSFDEIESVSFVDFELIESLAGTYIRIENPNRNARELFNFFEGAVGLGFTCAPVVFEYHVSKNLMSIFDAAQIVGLKVRDVVMGGGIIAKMEFSAPEGLDVECLEVARKYPHKKDVVCYDFSLKGLKGSAVFSSNGSVRVGGELAAFIVAMVEQELLVFS